MRTGELNEDFQRSRDVIAALRSLGRLGLSVSLPRQAANGEMCFKIEGCVLSVTQILTLWDRKELNRSAILKLNASTCI